MIFDTSDKSGERCMVCNDIYQEVYRVPDDLLEIVTGFENGKGRICLACFTRKAFRKGIKIFWEGEEGNFISQIIKKKILSIFGLNSDGIYRGLKTSKRRRVKKSFESEIAEILEHIFKLSGKRFLAPGNIFSRLRDGRTVGELKQIATTKSHDPHFRRNNWQYFNPVSLYTKKNFDIYLSQHPEDFCGQSNQQKSLTDWEQRKNEELKNQFSSETISIGSTVDYHSKIGGPPTSKNHKVLKISKKPNGFGIDVAWISNKEGCVSIASLTLSKTR